MLPKESIKMIIRKTVVLFRLGKPIVILVMALMAFVGALFSPNFYSNDFPPTFFSNIFSSIFPDIFSSQFFSLVHAFGASFIAVLIWVGTALFNDYYDVQIDESINPHRPLITKQISHKEVAYWAILAYIAAIILTLLEGDLICKLLVISFVFLGFQYSAPPFRLRRWGVIATSIIGIGITAAFIGGSASQYSISQEGIVVAIILGILASTISAVKDFKDIEGDQKAGIKTLPIIAGYESAIKIMMVTIALSYILALLPIFMGFFPPVMALFILLTGAANLLFMNALKNKRDVEFRRKTYIYCFMCYFLVVFIYVFAKIIQ